MHYESLEPNCDGRERELWLGSLDSGSYLTVYDRDVDGETAYQYNLVFDTTASEVRAAFSREGRESLTPQCRQSSWGPCASICAKPPLGRHGIHPAEHLPRLAPGTRLHFSTTLRPSERTRTAKGYRSRRQAAAPAGGGARHEGAGAMGTLDNGNQVRKALAESKR